MTTLRSCTTILLLMALLIALSVIPSAAKIRSGTLTVSVDLSRYATADEAELWLPYPVSDKEQRITDVKISGNYATSAVYTDRTYGTPMLYARWDKGAASRILTFSFKAERDEVIRRDFPAIESPWSPTDFSNYLDATSLGPIDGEVLFLAARITAGKKTVLEKARAIYDWTCENTYRDPATRGCGTGDVFTLLGKPGGKCADIRHDNYQILFKLAKEGSCPG